MPVSHEITFRKKIRYKFDVMISKGPIALIGWLGILSILLVICAGVEINFHTSVESAARRGEIAIGYRLNEYVHNSDKAYGVVVNSTKSKKIVLGDKDKVIVIAED
jgi:hypothetical protein